jgi:hypothetical protein
MYKYEDSDFYLTYHFLLDLLPHTGHPEEKGGFYVPHCVSQGAF